MGGSKPGCERAREWASLAPDGELSELERAALRRHLGECPACAEFASRVRALTGTLRDAPAAVPESILPLSPAGPAPPSRPAPKRLLRLVAVAGAAAVSVGLGSLAGSFSTSPPPVASPAALRAQTQQPYVEQRMLAMLRISALRGSRRAVPS